MAQAMSREGFTRAQQPISHHEIEALQVIKNGLTNKSPWKRTFRNALAGQARMAGHGPTVNV
jgi:hypothetical protein